MQNIFVILLLRCSYYLLYLYNDKKANKRDFHTEYIHVNGNKRSKCSTLRYAAFKQSYFEVFLFVSHSSWKNLHRKWLKQPKILKKRQFEFFHCSVFLNEKRYFLYRGILCSNLHYLIYCYGQYFNWTLSTSFS